MKKITIVSLCLMITFSLLSLLISPLAAVPIDSIALTDEEASSIEELGWARDGRDIGLWEYAVHFDDTSFTSGEVYEIPISTIFRRYHTSLLAIRTVADGASQFIDFASLSTGANLFIQVRFVKKDNVRWLQVKNPNGNWIDRSNLERQLTQSNPLYQYQVYAYLPSGALYHIMQDDSTFKKDSDGYFYYIGFDNDKGEVNVEYNDSNLINGPYITFETKAQTQLEYAYFDGTNYGEWTPITQNEETSNHMLIAFGQGVFNKDGEKVLSLPFASNSSSNLKPFKFKVRYKELKIDIPDDAVISKPENLPKTFNKTLGNVKFVVEGTNLKVQIDFNGKSYYMKYTMDSKTDMSMFKTSEAYFINETTPQIFINRSDRLYLRDILSKDKAPAFVPHVIWDLKTDNLTNVNTYKAYALLKQNDKGVLMAYYYTDAFVMDKILSASLSYTARYYEKLWWGWSTRATEWQSHQFEYTNQDTLIYSDKTSQWYDYITGFGLISLAIRSNTDYEMPRIAEVNLNNIQSDYNISKSEVENYYSSLSDEYVKIKDNQGYKLWAFALQEGKEYDMGWFGSMKTEFYDNTGNQKDPKNFKVMEIIYQTDGKVYQTIGSDIDLIVVTDPSDNGLIPKKNNFSLPLILAVGLLVLGTVLGFMRGLIITKKGINWKYVGGLLVFVVVVYLIAFFWPQITEYLIVLRL